MIGDEIKPGTPVSTTRTWHNETRRLARQGVALFDSGAHAYQDRSGYCRAQLRAVGGGVVVSTFRLVGYGPGQAPDFSDARYWAMGCTIPFSTTAAPTVAMNESVHVVALNLAEIGWGTASKGQHALADKPDRVLGTWWEVVPLFVLAWQLGGAWVFDLPPYIRWKMFMYDVTCLDADGCPVGDWYRVMPGTDTWLMKETPPTCAP